MAIQQKRKKGTRSAVLQAIKVGNRITVDEVADAVGVSPVTVRHHLNALMADGAIVSESVRTGIGRPFHVYFLTEAGEELFPKKYFSLSTRLLGELKEQFPPEMVNQLFESVVGKIVEEHRSEFEGLNTEKRLDYLIGLLSAEGFIANWEKTTDDQYIIKEHSCPYIGIGQEHDEICGFDTALIRAVMETEIEKKSCMLDGSDCCEFTLATTTTTIPLPEVNIA